VRQRRAAILAAVAVVLATSGPASAAQDQREVRAKKACAAGRVDEGVELLADLFTETGDLNYVYNQGRCYQQNGVADKAINRFREYLRRSTELAPQDRQEVEQFIAELEKQEERRATEAALRASQASRPSGADSARLKTIGLGLGAVGALAVGTAVVLSLKVRSEEREVEKKFEMQDKVTTQEVSVWMRDGGRLETFQWVAYGIGAAAFAGGATCYLLGYRGGREKTIAWTWTPDPVRRGLSTSLTVRY